MKSLDLFHQHLKCQEILWGHPDHFNDVIWLVEGFLKFLENENTYFNCKVVSAVPADGLAPSGARTSAGYSID